MNKGKQGYRWDNPIDWLEWSVNGMENPHELRSVINTLVSAMDCDTVQDLFQSDMDDDGYFSMEDE